MASLRDRSRLRSRHRITGRLVLDTALHIGGGREMEAATDSPVVRLPSGEPYIPGSSMKGAFRAAVERIAPAVGLRSCALIENDTTRKCLSTWRRWSKGYRTIARSVGQILQDNEENREDVANLELEPSEWIGHDVTEDRLLALLEGRLCDTCKTFGSVHVASVAAFDDLMVAPGEWHEIFQVRDGVGIDRDSERARDGIKFDFEVVPPETPFLFSVAMENAGGRDCQLVALGLQELVDGAIRLGGLRSRGLGRCRLRDLKVASVDFTDGAALRQYLLDRTMTEEDGATFIARHFDALLSGREG